MLRHLLLASLPFLVAGSAYAQGAACDPETFDNTCAGATLTFCPATGDNPNTENTIDCTFPPEGGGDPAIPNGTCAPVGCTDVDGQGCSLLDDTCVSGANDPCLGSGFLLDNDATNDNAAFAASCSAGDACVTAVDAAGQIAETCTPDAFVCEQPFTVGCNGDQLILCLGVSEDANANGALDAGEDKDGDGAISTGVTTSPFIMDCTGFFDGCNDTAADGPLHAAGLYGDGAGPAPDCNIPAEGEGEGEGEEGEGEGEGDAECEDDSDCGDGQTCEDGECIAPPPTCANFGGSSVAPLAGLAFVIALLGKRRRG